MAIVQISRIQHRRGLKESLPQLAAGEIGFAVDTPVSYTHLTLPTNREV